MGSTKVREVSILDLARPESWAWSHLFICAAKAYILEKAVFASESFESG